MAHSIQVFHERSEVLNDADLIIIIALSLDIILKSSHLESLRSLADEWRWMLDHYGPGVIDLKIEQLLFTSAQQQDFATLLAAIIEQANQYHDTIPASILKEWASVPGVTYVDYKVSILVHAVERLKVLLGKK